MNTTFWKGAGIWFAVGLIVGLLIGMAIGWRIDTNITGVTKSAASADTITATTTATTSTSTSGVTLVVNDQPAGRAAVIASATLGQGTWISIREILPSGDVGRILGAVRRDKGTYSNIVIDLLRTTVPNTSYAVVLYGDSGSKTFDPKHLPLIPGADGKTATTDFKALTPVAPAGQ